MKKPLLFAIFISLINFSCAQGPQADFAFTHVELLDMKSNAIQSDKTVFIKGGQIVLIADGDADVSNVKTVVNADGKYLMPGLAEMHAHIPGNQDTELLEETLFLYLSNGITTIRGMLGQPYHLELRDKVLAGEVLGPRIFTSGPSLNGNTVRSVEEAKRKVRAQKAAGYDFMKLHPGLTMENFNAIVETANEVGINYAGHVSIDVGVRRALEAQYASIDHVDGYIEGLVPNDTRVNPNANGFFGINFTDLADESLLQELIQMTLDNKVWIVPTQAMMERWVGPTDPEQIALDPEMKYMRPNTLNNWVRTKKNVLAQPDYNAERAADFNALRRKIIGDLHKAGVGILLGSDAPQVFNVPGFSIQRELDAMVRSGMSAYESLKAGTLNPAIFFELEGAFGTIENGAAADLILLSSNPLEDISNMRQQEGVMVRGQWLSSEFIEEKLAAIARKYGH